MDIIGIDPGGTTGIVVIEPSDDDITIVEALHTDSQGTAQWLNEHLNSTYDQCAVAIEKFNITMQTLSASRAGSLEALYTIGAVRYICFTHGTPIAYQTPAAAKNALNDEVLKNLGLWKMVTGPHEHDALRHALLYARTQRLWKGVAV